MRRASPGLPEKGGVSDWLEAGGTSEELERLVAEAAEWTLRGRPEPKPIGVLPSDVEPQEVSWLWYPRIPLGKRTMLDGDPGLGKSTLALDLAARVSTGRPMPGIGGVAMEPVGVVILTAEDDLADTVRPRLDAAGADTMMALALQVVPSGNPEGRLPVLPDDLSFLREAVERVDAKLVIVDPLVAFLPLAIDTYKDQSVRIALRPLAAFAEDTGVTILLIRHLNKSSSLANPLYRGGGSIGIISAARSALLVAKDPDDQTRRVLAPLNERHISERPPEAEMRSEIGHWEVDTVMGSERGRNSVVTLVERSTGFLVVGKLSRHCAADATSRLIELISRHEGRVVTITVDNGSEFHSYAQVEAATGVEFYFATPHHSWERGTCGNANGLMRQYLPKGRSMAHVTQEHCDEIAARLNSRPRKRLGYRTP